MVQRRVRGKPRECGEEVSDWTSVAHLFARLRDLKLRKQKPEAQGLKLRYFGAGKIIALALKGGFDP